MIPYYDKIEIEPVPREGIVANSGFQEMGRVISIGRDVVFVKPGDTLLFTAHGIWETAEFDGKKHYIIAEQSEFILGKVENVAEEPV